MIIGTKGEQNLEINFVFQLSHKILTCVVQVPTMMKNMHFKNFHTQLQSNKKQILCCCKCDNPPFDSFDSTPPEAPLVQSTKVVYAL